MSGHHPDGVAEVGQQLGDAATGLAGAAGDENGHAASVSLRQTLGMLPTLISMCDRLNMTSLDALLDGPRAQRAFLLKAVFAGTWSITVEDRAPLSLVVMARGNATFLDRSGTHSLAPGDVIVARGPATYRVADSAATPPDIRILPGQVCIDPSGAILAEAMSLGVRTWGNTHDRRRDRDADRYL